MPSAKVWHDIPLPKQSYTSVLHLKSSLRAYYTSRNRILFQALWSKNSVQRAVSLISALTIVAYYAITTALLDRSNRKLEVLLSLIKGLFDGLKLIRSGIRYYNCAKPI